MLYTVHVLAKEEPLPAIPNPGKVATPPSEGYPPPVTNVLVDTLKSLALTALEAEKPAIMAKLKEANYAVGPFLMAFLEKALPNHGVFALLKPSIENAFTAAEPQFAAALATEEDALYTLVVGALMTSVGVLH